MAFIRSLIIVHATNTSYIHEIKSLVFIEIFSSLMQNWHAS